MVFVTDVWKSARRGLCCLATYCRNGICILDILWPLVGRKELGMLHLILPHVASVRGKTQRVPFLIWFCGFNCLVIVVIFQPLRSQSARGTTAMAESEGLASGDRGVSSDAAPGREAWEVIPACLPSDMFCVFFHHPGLLCFRFLVPLKGKTPQTCDFDGHASWM